MEIDHDNGRALTITISATEADLEKMRAIQRHYNKKSRSDTIRQMVDAYYTKLPEEAK